MAGWYTVGTIGLILLGRELVAWQPDLFIILVGAFAVFVAAMALVENMEDRETQ